MSDANKLLLRRWFEQVWNQKSEAAIDEMFHPQGLPTAFLMRIRFLPVPNPSRLSIERSAARSLISMST